jgi:hypothetical protein
MTDGGNIPMEQLLRRLKEEGFHITIIAKGADIPYRRLVNAANGSVELRESDIRKVERFSVSVGVNPYAD